MSTPVVAVGIGNTTVKLGLTDGSASASEKFPPQWSMTHEIPTADFDPRFLSNSLADRPTRWRVASVQRTVERRLREWVSQVRPGDDYRLLSYRDLPLEIDVELPERVGMDRVASAVAAKRLKQPHQAAIVVDAGTALTVNLVDADGVFRGGVILPGFKLTAKALAEGTDLLPLITADFDAEPPPVVGRSTEAAIRSGLFWGSLGAVRELVQRMTQQVGSPVQVFVTGGDARRLAKYMSPDAQFVPDLVLIGIVSCSR